MDSSKVMVAKMAFAGIKREEKALEARKASLNRLVATMDKDEVDKYTSEAEKIIKNGY